MESINETITTNYKGSVATAKMVREEIRRRWGDQDAEQYDALRNTMSYPSALKLGYRIKKGEKAIKSFTFIGGDEEGKEGGKKKYFKVCNLFFLPRQAEKIN